MHHFIKHKMIRQIQIQNNHTQSKCEKIKFTLNRVPHTHYTQHDPAENTVYIHTALCNICLYTDLVKLQEANQI